MKKLVSILLAALMLLGCCAALAEEAAPFTFRGGLHWGMTVDEVIAAEGVQPVRTEEYSYHITKVVFENMTVSSYSCTITYWFVDGGLAQSEIKLSDEWSYFDYKDPEIVKELSTALDYAYGEAVSADAVADEKLIAAYEAITNGKPSSTISFSVDYDKLYRYWLPADGSAIAIAGHNDALFLHYVNVEIDWENAICEEAPVVTPVPNTTGL